VSFTELGLAHEIARAVREKGYEAPTPIQKGTIPGVIAGRDLIGCAQTGTGKTAAFTLPILHRLRAGARGRLRALILTPTRELALQIGESLRAYGRHVHLASAVIHGGVSYQPQEAALRRGVDVLVATPGRLLDHMERGKIDFRGLEVLVLDEADRMLDMGFIRDVRRIIRALPGRRQTLFFSATMPDEVRRLSKEILRDPINVEVAPRRSAPAHGVRQSLLPVARERKRELLAHLVETEARGQTLVFTRTKHGANKLARHLEKRGHGVAVLHGNRSQAQRTKALDAFKKRRARVMVATDIAGRGIDVEGITHVVNYDLPNVPEDYVHRIGRTARAGATGDAISLMAPDERPHVRAIETLIGRTIECRTVQGFTDRGASSPQGFTDRAARPPQAARRHGGPARRHPFPSAAHSQPPRRTSDWRGRGSRRKAS
jgi:ATP-dependent RNA helicase RhlE